MNISQVVDEIVLKELEKVMSTPASSWPKIYVPTYHRPRTARILDRLTLEPELKFVLCLYDDDLESYRAVWGDRVEYLVIPSTMHDLGWKRQQIQRLLTEQHIEEYFMFDDSVDDISLGLLDTRGFVRVTKKVLSVDIPWAAVLQVYLNIIHSLGVSNIVCGSLMEKNFLFTQKEKLVSFNSGVFYKCMYINARNAARFGVTYKPLPESGFEDVGFLMDAIKAGGVCVNVKRVCFGSRPANTQVQGGCHEHDTTQEKMIERYHKQHLRLFEYIGDMKQYLTYYEHGHPRFKTINNIGFTRMKFRALNKLAVDSIFKDIYLREYLSPKVSDEN